MSEDSLLKVAEVTELLSISRRTLYRLIDSGDLVPIYLDRLPRFDPKDIRALVARRRGKQDGVRWME